MSGNYEDSLNQGLQIGRLTGELAEVQGKAATAGIRAVDNETQARTAKKALAKEREANEELTKQLAEKEALLTEWMLSTESFKTMARIFGKELNLTDDQRQATYLDSIIEVVESKPEFKNTKLYNKALVAKAENK
jgi:hypothetical protein